MEQKEINSSVGKINDIDAIIKRNKEKSLKKVKLVENLINQIASNEVGRDWLRFIYSLSEFGNVSLDINPNLLQRREALRYFYVKAFRQFFNASTLKIVEGLKIEQDEEIEE